jgi:hypothetical protein
VRRRGSIGYLVGLVTVVVGLFLPTWAGAAVYISKRPQPNTFTAHVLVVPTTTCSGALGSYTLGWSAPTETKSLTGWDYAASTTQGSYSYTHVSAATVTVPVSVGTLSTKYFVVHSEIDNWISSDSSVVTLSGLGLGC